MSTPRVWLGVCGWPVAHSRSPRMHNAALAAAGLRDWRYTRLPLPPGLFARTVSALPGRGFRGVNVTIPHKRAALDLATRATPDALAIGAANTLTFEPDGTIAADNTDAPGLLSVLRRRMDPAGRTALVLGAGGAGRAAVHALTGAGAEVVVWNRTPERAEELARALGARAARLPVAADIVVNCTAVGLHADPEAFKRLPLSADTVAAGSCVVDMVYRDGDTPVLAAARRWGADTVGGLEILIAQGAASFERWTGQPPDLGTMARAAAENPSHEPTRTDRPGAR